MLVVNNIEVVYSEVIWVLRGVTLEIAEGSMVALLGANGAGKTTTLKAISGLLWAELGKITAGSVEYGGRKIDRLKAEDIARLGVIQVLEGHRLFEHLTTEENLRMGGHLFDGQAIKQKLDMVYGYFPRLRERRGEISGYLSGGEQQMLVIGRALMSSPELMMLDEPSLGLAPLLVLEIFDIVSDINFEKQTAILLVEQNAKAALAITDYGYIMENGRVVLEGPSEKLVENEDIKEFYLGLSQLGERKSYREIKHYKRRKRWLG
ncbi:MAG: ABC transporter ATP-binding protein [Proteobacteria bacterium]|nr:ABC transporter ATP-binding protein [Pseudomonadota bacterium]